MRLRLRLAVTVLAAAVPLAAGTAWMRADVQRRAQEDVLREFALARMENGGRELCELSPDRFPPRRGGRRPPPGMFGGPGDPFGIGGRRRDRMGSDGDVEVDGRPRRRGGRERRRPDDIVTDFWAYADDLVSKNPDAPELAPELAAAMRAGGVVASRVVPAREDQVGREAVVRMPWTDSPCAFVLVRRTWPEEMYASSLWWWSAALLAGGVLVAVLLAMGPVVARVRRLTSDVRRAAADRYDTSVDVRGSDEISELAQAFNEAGSEVRDHVATIEKREETLRTFVANTTHDVMTPLTVLQGYLDEMRGAADESGELSREALRGAIEETQYTTSLIHNLSAAAKLDAATEPVESHPVDLCRLVERVGARHRPVARERGVELEHVLPGEPLHTMGDETLLEQAVSNVVHNAVRYNAPGGHVALVLRARNAERFELRIVDDGPGVDRSELPLLTERSFRGAEARTRSPSGTGVGLHIAGDVCARHGIELRFAASDHGGLEVIFDGRLAPEAPARS